MKKLGIKEEKENNEKIEKLLTKNPEIILVHVTDTYFIEESKINDKIDLSGFARFRSLVNHIKIKPYCSEKQDTGTCFAWRRFSISVIDECLP